MEGWHGREIKVPAVESPDPDLQTGLAMVESYPRVHVLNADYFSVFGIIYS